jgi:hypothetical protein
MTANRPFEVTDELIERMLAERAGFQAPWDFVASTATAIGQTRQAGRWQLSVPLRTMPHTRTGWLLVGLVLSLLAVAAVMIAVAVGSGLVRFPSVVAPSRSPEATLASPPAPSAAAKLASPSAPSPAAATASPTPAGPLGGGLILAHDLTRIGDHSVHDVIALDPGTGERTLLGTLPGQDVWTYLFQRNADRDHVLVLTNNGLGAVSNLEAPTAASRPFGFIAKRDVAYGTGLVLSPRGDRIAGVDDFDHPKAIVISGVERGSATLAVPSGVERLLVLSWSPDESAVLALGCRPCNKAATPTERQTADHEHLYIVPLDGSPWRELLDDDNGYVLASWSPDGSTLAVTHYACAPKTVMPRCPPGGMSTMSLLDLGDGSERQLTIGTERNGTAAWSADGRQLAYVGGKAGDVLVDGGVYVMNADGTGAVKLADTSADMPPVWSPDGQWLLFQSAWDTTEWWIVPAGGGVPRSIGNYGGAAW